MGYQAVEPLAPQIVPIKSHSFCEKYVTSVFVRLHVLREARLCHWMCSFWHLEDTTVLRQTWNYSYNDTLHVSNDTCAHLLSLLSRPGPFNLSCTFCIVFRPYTNTLFYYCFVVFWRGNPPPPPPQCARCLLIHEVYRSHKTTHHSR